MVVNFSNNRQSPKLHNLINYKVGKILILSVCQDSLNDLIRFEMIFKKVT